MELRKLVFISFYSKDDSVYIVTCRENRNIDSYRQYFIKMVFDKQIHKAFFSKFLTFLEQSIPVARHSTTDYPPCRLLSLVYYGTVAGSERAIFHRLFFSYK